MFISLDLETTGFDSTKDKIIEFGAVKFDLDGPKETLQFFCNPGFKIADIITHITHITNDDLRSSEPFQTQAQRVRDFIGDSPIVGHNIKFDIDFLNKNGVETTNPLYDTQELAGILIPDMTSYSLEILTQKLDVKHEEKHRALNDAVACMELFIKLIKELNSLEPALLQKIQNLCQKSNWPLKKIFCSAEIKPEKDLPKPISFINSSKVPDTKAKKDLTETQKEFYKKILNQEQSALFESDFPYTSLIEYLTSGLEPSTYVSIPYQLFRQIHQEIPGTVAKIDSPQNYLSLTRLEQFARQEHFENYELIALLKYLIFSKRTKTGLLSEVSLFNLEKTTLSKVNIDESIENPETEDFYKKALEKDANSASLCTHQFIVDNFSKNPENLKDSHLIIIDLESFSNALRRQQSPFLKLDAFLNILKNLEILNPDNSIIQTLTAKLTILFGLIGIIFKKDYVEDDYIRRASVTPNTIASKDWHEAKSMINNLIEISQELINIKSPETSSYLRQWKNRLKELHEIFFDPKLEENFIWIDIDRQENIVIKKIPYSIKNSFKNLLENSRNYTLIDENIELSDGGRFIKNLYGLQPELPIYKIPQKPENLSILLCKDANESDRNQLPKFFIDYYKKSNENIALIFTARKYLESFTLALSQENIPNVSQLVGSFAKLKEHFIQRTSAGERPLLLLTPNCWENFENQESIETVFVHRLPFDPPSDPELLALSQNYEDPFSDLQIPRVTMCLKKIINRLSNKTKKVVILDNRMFTKGYGKEIIKNLDAMSQTEVVNLKDLL